MALSMEDIANQKKLNEIYAVELCKLRTAKETRIAASQQIENELREIYSRIADLEKVTAGSSLVGHDSFLDKHTRHY